MPTISWLKFSIGNENHQIEPPNQSAATTIAAFHSFISTFRSGENRRVIVMTKLNIWIRHSGVIRYRAECNHNMPYLCHNEKTAMVLFPKITYSRYITSADLPASKEIFFKSLFRKNVKLHMKMITYSIFRYSCFVTLLFIDLWRSKTTNQYTEKCLKLFLFSLIISAVCWTTQTSSST